LSEDACELVFGRLSLDQYVVIIMTIQRLISLLLL